MIYNQVNSKVRVLNSMSTKERFMIMHNSKNSKGEDVAFFMGTLLADEAMLRKSTRLMNAAENKSPASFSVEDELKAYMLRHPLAKEITLGDILHV